MFLQPVDTQRRHRNCGACHFHDNTVRGGTADRMDVQIRLSLENAGKTKEPAKPIKF